MDSFSYEKLEAAVQIAENHWNAGNLELAFQEYQRILRGRVQLKRELTDDFSFTAADIFLMERTADLASLFDQAEAADGLYASIISLTEDAGNLFAADYARLKGFIWHYSIHATEMLTICCGGWN